MNPTKEGIVRVRFAPSPTGLFHIGGARTALFNWLFTRQHNGVFVLRIEDTDKERSSSEYEKEIFDSLTWLGIQWDEGSIPPGGTFEIQDSKFEIGNYGPYRQSERTSIYKNYIEKLLKESKAYRCYCTKEELEAQRQSMLAQGIAPRYSGHCRNLPHPPEGNLPYVVRFKTPETTVEFKDIIRGTVSFETSLLGDFAIAKDETTPLYNFAVVIDDYEMRISHVIRGEDHLSNTPKQILIQRALGLGEPAYAHLPLILAPDRSKLSKRYAEVSLLAYKEQGYLPETLINFIALLGWHPKTDKEVLTNEELLREFDLKRVQKAGAVLSAEKLDWLNREHLKMLSSEQLFDLLLPGMEQRGIKAPREMVLKVIGAERERMKTVADFFTLADFFFELPHYEARLLIWGHDEPAKTMSLLDEEIAIVGTLEKIDSENVRRALSELSQKHGNGSVFWPLRTALSGKEASPDPFIIAEILGKDEVMRRLRGARDKFGPLL